MKWSEVWYGMVWFGMVWPVWYGSMIWYGMAVWYGVVWQYDMVWYVSMIWYGMAVWCGVVWYGVVRCVVVWCGMVWCGMEWCGVVWCGMVWYGMAWYGVQRIIGFLILIIHKLQRDWKIAWRSTDEAFPFPQVCNFKSSRKQPCCTTEKTYCPTLCSEPFSPCSWRQTCWAIV